MLITDEMREIIRDIIEDWDPLLGAQGHQPYEGQYDGLISKVVMALEADTDAPRVAHNIHETVDLMGVSLPAGVAEQIVADLLGALLDTEWLNVRITVGDAADVEEKLLSALSNHDLNPTECGISGSVPGTVVVRIPKAVWRANLSGFRRELRAAGLSGKLTVIGGGSQGYG